MGFYDAFKDALNVAQKADNVELYRQLLDLSAQALDLQEENARLRKVKDLEAHIVRHMQPYITMSGDEKSLPYCAICWAKENKLYQMRVLNPYGYAEVYCKNCGNRCRYETQGK